MLYVLLPVYNEGQSIFDLLSRMRNLMESQPREHVILIVNDGSSDDSAALIEAARSKFASLSIQYVEHPRNFGFAQALRTGFSRLTEIGGDDVLVTMDGDNTHDPTAIPAMLAAIDRGADIVIASRYRRGSVVTGLSLLRRALSAGAAIIYYLRWRLPGVRDYTTGFRAYRGHVIVQFLSAYGDSAIEETGFAALPEILRKTSRFAPIIREVPLVFDYSKKLSKTNNPIWRTIAMSLAMLFKRY